MELSNPGTRVTYSLFDTLIRRDFMGSPDGGGSGLKPHLATSWERKGPTELVVTLRVGPHHLRASVPAHVAIKVEDAVRFGWTPDKVMFFDSKSGLNIGRGS